eukprot:CAMPEP_0184547434 /NCGR_PEP_ID=MMETSP0199_2-20130426/5570_1 /TAXON_ID=1112570 /ORGANISM="Thraustochytrium sp., Strain LLF1b" /LENGTH=583 /DNA_ID=CAMNT_0026941929 /DNA_START=282 /DNA_END=2030 /DNA_ORIENTATION=-
MKIDVKKTSKGKKASKVEKKEPVARTEEEIADEALAESSSRAFALKLASNLKQERDDTQRALRKWLRLQEKANGEIEMLALLKLWKGLFYCMWMSDKVPVQQDLAERIASLVSAFKKPANSILFYRAFAVTMRREWAGLDKLRLDKFYSLIRFVTRELLIVGYKTQKVVEVADTLRDEFLMVKPDGLPFHICDLILAELEKTECADDATLMEFLGPFFCVLGSQVEYAIFHHCLKVVFVPLLEEKEEDDNEDMDENMNQGEPSPAILPELNRATVAQALFTIAADIPDLKERHRKKLFEIYKEFKVVAKAWGHNAAENVTEPVTNMNLGEVFDQLGDSPSLEAKKGKASRSPKSKPTKDAAKKEKAQTDPEDTATPTKSKTKKATEKAKSSTKKAKATPQGSSKSKAAPEETKEVLEPVVAKSLTPKSKKKAAKSSAVEEDAEPEKVTPAKKTPKSAKKKRSSLAPSDTPLATPGKKTPKQSSKSSAISEESAMQEKKKLRFAPKFTQAVEHEVSWKRLRTTPIKPTAHVSSPKAGALKVTSFRDTPRPQLTGSVKSSLRMAEVNKRANEKPSLGRDSSGKKR